MHAVHIVPGINRIGGAERQALLLTQGLARRNWRVTVIALSGDGGSTARDLTAAGVEFLALGMRKGIADPRGWLRLRQWLRRNTPDVVHAHLPHAVWMARLIRLLVPLRVVVDTVHTASTGPPGRRLLYRCTARLSDCVTVVSHGVESAYTEARLIPAGRMRLISNGIDTNSWHSDSAAGAKLRVAQGIHGQFLWFAAGRLDPVKNYPVLLEAFAHLPSTALLVIAGTGPLETELRQLCRRLGIAQRVLLLGCEHNVRSWMQAADAFVLASRWEGLPMTLLEAGACGLASVATCVAGSNEVILDGESGFLATPDDADSLRRAMLRMMEMAPANRLAMGMNARQRIVETFGLDSVLDRWEALYARLSGERQFPTRWIRRS